jgi:hypothetical protein
MPPLEMVASQKLELVVDEAGPVHRLDDRAHHVAVPGDRATSSCKPSTSGVAAVTSNRPAFLVDEVHIKPLARQVQSGVQHAWASRCWLR